MATEFVVNLDKLAAGMRQTNQEKEEINFFLAFLEPYLNHLATFTYKRGEDWSLEWMPIRSFTVTDMEGNFLAIDRLGQSFRLAIHTHDGTHFLQGQKPRAEALSAKHVGVCRQLIGLLIGKLAEHYSDTLPDELKTFYAAANRIPRR